MTLPLFSDDAPEKAAKMTVWSVTELTREIREVLEGEIGQVWVRGEIANYRRQASGHQYFTLKDSRAQLPCVWFLNPRTPLRGVTLADGMLVQAKGTLTVYEVRGQYQLSVQLVQAAGAGELAAKFEQLKQRLAAEGLFAAERKRVLPKFPQRIGIVTSSTGAALRDMLQVLERRAPWIEIMVLPVRVQGSGAAREIGAAVAEFNGMAEHGLAVPEVIVLCRGGGSMEDLWEFNDEPLARVIFASAIPVVSAVGHEIDFTIADFVADLRAPTPSAAAELIAPDGVALLAYLASLEARFTRCTAAGVERARRELMAASRAVTPLQLRRHIDAARQRLDDLSSGILAHLKRRLERSEVQLQAAAARVRAHRPDRVLEAKAEELRRRITRLHEVARTCFAPLPMRLRQAEQKLQLLGPQQTLERGYSITTDEDGAVLTDAAAVAKGAAIVTTLAKEKLRSVVS